MCLWLAKVTMKPIGAYDISQLPIRNRAMRVSDLLYVAGIGLSTANQSEDYEPHQNQWGGGKTIAWAKNGI